MNYGQATLNSSTPTPIVNLADRRDVVLIIATAACYIGDANVTASTGVPIPANIPIYLAPGNPLTVAAQGTLYGITSSGAATVGWLDMANQEP